MAAALGLVLATAAPGTLWLATSPAGASPSNPAAPASGGLGSGTVHGFPSTTVSVNALGCATATTCFATTLEKTTLNGNPTFAGGIVTVENGVPGTPVVPDAHIYTIGPIACASATACVAAGSRFETVNGQLTPVTDLIPIDNGVIGTPVEDASITNGLLSLACPSATLCIGTAWASNTLSEIVAVDPATLAVTALDAPTLDAQTQGLWSSVGCTGPQPGGDPPVCVVGGTDSRSGGSQAATNELEAVSGTTAFGPFPAPTSDAPSEYEPLTSISCPTTTECQVAAGDTTDNAEGATFGVDLSVTGTGAHENVGLTSGLLEGVPGTTSIRTVACGADAGCVLGGWSGTSQGALISLDPTTEALGTLFTPSGLGQVIGGDLAPSLTVDSTGDAPAADPSAGCATAAGKCTLRAALQAVNAGASGTDVFVGGTADYAVAASSNSIGFDIAGGSGMPEINVTSALPAVQEPVDIDGTTQPGTPSGEPGVRVDGSGVPAGSQRTPGLVLGGGSSTLKGLDLTGFSGPGVSLQGSGGDQVTGSWLGVSPGTGGSDAYAAHGNGDGIEVASPNANLDSDVLSANGNLSGLQSFTGDPNDPATGASQLSALGAGVLVDSAASSGLQVTGDTIGLSPAGDPGSVGASGLGAFANPVGVALVPGSGALTNATIGGGSGHGDTITGNFVGVLADALPAGSSITGLSISGDAIGAGITSSSPPLSPAGVIAGGTGKGSLSGLSITGNRFDESFLGAGLAGGGIDGATVTGNTFGGTSAGSPHVMGIGALVNGGSDVSLGGTAAGEGNTVDAQLAGLVLDGGQGGHVVANNVGPAGTSSSDLSSLAGVGGIVLHKVKGDVIGEAGHGNTVSNETLGIVAAASTSLTLAADRTSGGVVGLWLDDDRGVTVGGSKPAAVTTSKNVLGFLADDGVPTSQEAQSYGTTPSELDQQDPFTTSTDRHDVSVVEGVAPFPGLAKSDQLVSGADTDVSFSHDTIGGKHAADGNWVAGAIVGDATSFSIDDTTVHGNEATGILVGGGTGQQPTGVSLHSDRFSDNQTNPSRVPELRGKGLGFDLVVDNRLGPTKNHPGGSVSGAPNFEQDYPVFRVVGGSGSPTAQGSVEGDPDAHVVVQLFSNTACTKAGFGEAADPIATLNLTTNGSGTATFDIPVPVKAGTVVTADATELHAGSIGDTSEFSHCETAP